MHLRLSRAVVIALIAGALAVSSSTAAWSLQSTVAPQSCVVIDTDWDIDDLMAIPAVVAQRNVAAMRSHAS